VTSQDKKELSPTFRDRSWSCMPMLYLCTVDTSNTLLLGAILDCSNIAGSNRSQTSHHV